MKWLCLFMLAMVPLAVGDSFDYQGAGVLANHTAFTKGSISAGSMWEIGDRLLEIIDLTTGHTTIGNLGIVDVTTGVLSKCAVGFCFSGGTLDIDSKGGGSIFDGSFTTGTISTHNGTVTLSAFLANGAATVIRDNKNSFSTQAIVHGVSPVPEPVSLMLMGTGLLVLSVVRARKKIS